MVRVAARCRVPTLIVVPTKAIREQWLDELAEVFPRLRCGSYVNPPKRSRKIPPTAETHDVAFGLVFQGLTVLLFSFWPFVAGRRFQTSRQDFDK